MLRTFCKTDCASEGLILGVSEIPSAQGTSVKSQSQVEAPKSHENVIEGTETALKPLHTQPALISIRSPTPEATAFLGEGETILKDSARSWPGMHLSWRILSLPAHPKQIVVNRVSEIGTRLHNNDSASKLSKPVSLREPSRRPRPSKKRRDLSKKKFAHRQALIDETKTKEEHEKEKRNKKNRDRKMKRRAKERREKDEAKAELLPVVQEEAG
ncbi:hypothetical protein MRB53_040676 [Persea americana]|nr:hypothetical protein MRB53_040676 [Persea americana]